MKFYVSAGIKGVIFLMKTPYGKLVILYNWNAYFSVIIICIIFLCVTDDTSSVKLNSLLFHK